MQKPVRKIVAIGGGDIRTGSTLLIDKEIIRLAKVSHPKLLFIPTASSDDVEYWKGIDQYFGQKLNCRTDVLFLLKVKSSRKEISRKILGADIIYVGGGNTLKMMNLWRRLGVDKLLKTAWQRGIVLCGMSAGSICWFESGHSDSMSFYNPQKWKYIRVSGLGLLKGIHCPHFNANTLGVLRRDDFSKMIRDGTDRGIAIEDNCALEFLDDQYRVISSGRNAKAYKIYRMKGKIIIERIQQTGRFLPISTLY